MNLNPQVIQIYGFLQYFSSLRLNINIEDWKLELQNRNFEISFPGKQEFRDMTIIYFGWKNNLSSDSRITSVFSI